MIPKIVLAFGFLVSYTVVAEPPSSGLLYYGAPPQQQSYIAYSSPNTGYDSSSDDDASLYVDDNLLARVAQLLEQAEAQEQGQGGYPSSAYGAPSSSGGILLGRPERAQEIASFDLTTNSGGYSNTGGYSGGYN